MRNIRNGLVSLLCGSMLAGCPQAIPSADKFANTSQDAQVIDAGNSSNADGGYDSNRNPLLDTSGIDSPIINYTDGTFVVDSDTIDDAINVNDLNANDVVGYDSLVDSYDANLSDALVDKDEGSDTNSLLDTIVYLDSAKEDVPVVADIQLQDTVAGEDVLLSDILQDVAEVLMDIVAMDTGATDTSVADSFEVGKDAALEVLLTKDVSLDVATSCYSNYFQSQSSINNLVAQNGTFIWNKGQYVQQTDNSVGTKVAYFDNFAWDKLNLQAKVRIPVDQSGVQKVGLLFRYTPTSYSGYDANLDKGYFISLEKNMNGKFNVALEDLDKGEIKSVALDASVTGLNTWHTLAIKAQGNTLNGYLNGKQVFQINDAKYLIGEIGFATYNSSGDFDDLLSCLP